LVKKKSENKPLQKRTANPVSRGAVWSSRGANIRGQQRATTAVASRPANRNAGYTNKHHVRGKIRQKRKQIFFKKYSKDLRRRRGAEHEQCVELFFVRARVTTGWGEQQSTIGGKRQPTEIFGSGFVAEQLLCRFGAVLRGHLCACIGRQAPVRLMWVMSEERTHGFGLVSDKNNLKKPPTQTQRTGKGRLSAHRE
jgi:hypothetical protein